MNIKSILGYSSIILAIGLTSARQYPIQQVTVNNCIPEQETCTMPLPRIIGANYDAYRNNSTHRRIYTVLRGATYPWQRDQWAWSHKGVDIASIPKTPIYAIQSGTVIEAGWRSNRGNVIVIEHTYSNTNIYSSYAHMGAIFVKKWDSVWAGQNIGDVWDTGNTSWPHLHFQIDTNQNWVYPFHFYNCPGSLVDIVNDWLCRNQLIENTIDPIVFLEQRIQESQETIKPNTNFVFNNFAWGHSKRNTMQFINVRQKELSNTIAPITIKFDTEKLRVFPREITFVWSQRTIYFKWLENGFTTIDLRQNNRIIKRIPLIINDEQTFNIDNKTITDLFEQIPLQ